MAEPSCRPTAEHVQKCELMKRLRKIARKSHDCIPVLWHTLVMDYLVLEFVFVAKIVDMLLVWNYQLWLLYEMFCAVKRNKNGLLRFMQLRLNISLRVMLCQSDAIDIMCQYSLHLMKLYWSHQKQKEKKNMVFVLECPLD